MEAESFVGEAEPEIKSPKDIRPPQASSLIPCPASAVG